MPGSVTRLLSLSVCLSLLTPAMSGLILFWWVYPLLVTAGCDNPRCDSSSRFISEEKRKSLFSGFLGKALTSFLDRASLDSSFNPMEDPPHARCWEGMSAQVPDTELQKAGGVELLR